MRPGFGKASHSAEAHIRIFDFMDNDSILIETMHLLFAPRANCDKISPTQTGAGIMNEKTTSNNHVWRFFRAGGFDQVRLDRGADLAHLDQLDQKLWVALACPTSGLEFDTKTLALIDTDKDGRVRAPEIIAAVQWACSCLKQPDNLLKGSTSLPLSAINDAMPEGKQLLSSAKQILVNLGKADAPAITIEDTTDTVKIFAQTHFNGDGIVPADAADNPAVKAVLNDIMTCLGAESDRSGKPGVSQAQVDQFFAEAQAFSDWWKKSEADATVLPLGEATAGAAASVKAVKVKVDDYFTRCRLAAFDSRAINALNREEKEYFALSAKDLTVTAAEISSFPLARVEPGKALPLLLDAVNPAWAGALATLHAQAVKPLIGDKSALTETDWATLQAKLAAFEDWSAGKAGASVQPLGLKRVREILASKAKDPINALIVKDKAEEGNANAIALVDQLVRYHRDLYLLCTNFVNFKDFYDRGEPAIFQAGRLYLDTRSCELCLRVEDAAKHNTMAGLSRAYLAYCDCVRKATGEKMTVVAAFTNGDSDNLIVGRNGLFYDRKGQDWDATIVKIVENPISIRQAFWAPYKKLVRFIEDQVAKRAAAADADATKKLAERVQKVEKAAETGKASEPPKSKIDTGVIAALGVAAAGIGGMFGGLIAGFLGLGLWMPIGLLAIILLISGPSMILAWLKLRQRNLGPLLDANGWAVNAKAKINLPFGGSLTSIAKLPPGSERDLTDPFAEKKRPWKLWITLLVIVVLAFLWYRGSLDSSLPGSIKSTTLLGTNAPAYKPSSASPAQSKTEPTNSIPQQK
jgi:hypothetical protein